MIYLFSKKPLKIEIDNRRFELINTCPICNKNNIYELFNIKCEELNDVSFSKYIGGCQFFCVVCKTCKLVYITPSLKQELLNNYYQSQEVKNNQEEELYLPIIKVILEYKKGGNLLDVGFGNGEVLKLAKEYRFNPHGVEINKKAIKMMKEKDYKVYEGEFLSLELPEDYFDVITFLSVIEHIKEVVKVVKKAYRLLKKDGIILLTVPNLSLSAKILKENWLYLSPYIGHIYCFGVKNISKILDIAGFELLTIRLSQFSPDLGITKYHNLYLSFIRFVINNLNYCILSYLRNYLKCGDVILAIGKKT